MFFMAASSKANGVIVAFYPASQESSYIPLAMPPMITFAEMRVSYLKIVRIIQRQYFPDELESLRDGKQFMADPQVKD